MADKKNEIALIWSIMKVYNEGLVMYMHVYAVKVLSNESQS